MSVLQTALFLQIIAAVENSIKTNLQHGPQSCAGRDERQFFTGVRSV